MKFLETLQIPVIATLRDSQNYIKAAETGTGIFEMKSYVVSEDLDQWTSLINWVNERKAIEIAPGSPAITSSMVSSAVVAPAGALRTMPAMGTLAAMMK